MISDEVIATLRGAHGRTTPGWGPGDSDVHLYGHNDSALPGQVATFHMRPAGITPAPKERQEVTANRDFAVLAHQHLPAVLDELVLLRAMVAGLQNDSAAAEMAIRLTRENARLREALGMVAKPFPGGALSAGEMAVRIMAARNALWDDVPG